MECAVTFLNLLYTFAKFRHHSPFTLCAAVREGIEAYEGIFFKEIWVLSFTAVEQGSELSESAAPAVHEEYVFRACT